MSADELAALVEAIEGQNLYHGCHSTTPAGQTTAMAIRAGLLARGYVIVPAAPPDRLDAPVHPFTCGTCVWEGRTRREYLRHCVLAGHDDYEAVRAALTEPAP